MSLCSVVGREAVASVSLCAVNDPTRFIERTRRCFTRKRHRCARFPHSRSETVTIDVVDLKAVGHTAKHVEVRGSLRKAIAHDVVRGMGSPPSTGQVCRRLQCKWATQLASGSVSRRRHISCSAISSLCSPDTLRRESLRLPPLQTSARRRH